MSTKSTSGKSTIPKNLTTMVVTEGEWEYRQDGFGDWRGWNEAMGLRTRLKFSLAWAKTDVRIKRLQVRSADGAWVDRIR